MGIPCRILLPDTRVVMDPAVEFDDQPEFRAEEIDDESVNDLLSPESEPFRAIRAQ
jgi:hypothetical protein